MIGRRLLMGGGGSFVTPYPPGDGVLTYGTPFDITNNSKANGLPTACALANGDWFLVYVNPTTFEATKADIVGKISSDEGLTWGSEFAVVSDATLSTFNPGVMTTSTGRVVLAYNLYNTGVGTSADAVRVIYSDDADLGGGATWSSPYTVNASFTGYCANGTSRLVQLGNGTILLPVYGDSGGFSSSAVFFSTDDGATFGGEVIMANGPGTSRHYYEPSIARLQSGTLLAQYRTTSAAGDMYQNESTNNGATWSTPTISIGAYSPSNLIQRPNGTIVAAVRANAASDPTAFTSLDAGATWSDQGAIESVFQTVYALWMERLDGSGVIIYGKQPSVSDSDIDIRGVVVTEGVA